MRQDCCFFFQGTGFSPAPSPKYMVRAWSGRSQSLPRSCCIAWQDCPGESGDLKRASGSPRMKARLLQAPSPPSQPPQAPLTPCASPAVAGSAHPRCPFVWPSCYFLLLFTSTAIYLCLNVINSTFRLFLKAKYLWKVILSQTHIPSLTQI